MASLIAFAMCLGCDVGIVQKVGGEAVDVELVLAVDVSRSMDQEEIELQRSGYVAALRDPEFVRAVKAGMNGRIAITYFEWAASPREESLVKWAIIDGEETANAFAGELAARPYNGYRGTSISGALTYATALFDANPYDGYRRVIDVSGDGANNIGLPVTGARDAALQKGVIINGLPILLRPGRSFGPLDEYYEKCVTGGPGSFVLPIKNLSEFATAIRMKLIMEVSGTTPPPRFIRTQAGSLDPCLMGERDRRFYDDPYFGR